MGKKCLLVLLSSFVVCLSGCGGSSGGGGSGGSCYIDGSLKAYQYKPVETSCISVDYDGERRKLNELPRNVGYELGSPMYRSDVVTVVIEGKSYTGKIKNYIPVEDIIWSYDGKSAFPEDFNSKKFDKEKLKGILYYSDDSVEEVVIEDASIEYDNSTGTGVVSIYDGLNTFKWDVQEEGLSPEVEEEFEKKSKEMEEKK